MPIRAITLHRVTCDVCDDVLPLHDTPEDAADNASQCGWLITTDRRAICPDSDHRHHAAIHALMPPEPRIEIDGQLHLSLRDGDHLTS